MDKVTLGKELKKLLRYAGAKIEVKSDTADGIVFKVIQGNKKYTVFVAAA